MPAIIHTKTTTTRPPGVAVRAWRTITRAAHVAQGIHWLTRFLPIHFEPFAAAKYGYKRRSPKYQQKEKDLAGKFGLSPDAPRALIHTGDMQTSVRASGQVQGFPTRAKITLNGPSYLTMRPRDGRRPDLAAELFRVTPGEQAELERTLDAEISTGLANLRQPETVTT